MDHCREPHGKNWLFKLLEKNGSKEVFWGLVFFVLVLFCWVVGVFFPEKDIIFQERRHRGKTHFFTIFRLLVLNCFTTQTSTGNLSTEFQFSANSSVRSSTNILNKVLNTCCKMSNRFLKGQILQCSEYLYK